MKRILNSIAKLSEWTALLGLHELVALAAFLSTVAVWAVTLGVMYR